jgi:ribosomal protein L29
MKHKTPVAELERMTLQELRKELELKRAEAAKMRIELGMQSEKNSGHYQLKRREIARMTMVLGRMAAKSPTKASQSAKKPVKRSGSKAKKSS